MKILIYILFIFVIFSCSKKDELNLFSSIFEKNQLKNLNINDENILLDSLNKKPNVLSLTKSSVNSLFDLSTKYYYLNDYSESLKISRNALSISKFIRDTLSIAKSYNYIGDAHEMNHKDSSYFYYQKAEKLYQFLGNNELRAKMLFNKAYILFFEGTYVESEIQLSNALQLLKLESNHELNYTVYNLMGCNLEKLDDYDNSLNYFNLAQNELDILNNQDVYFNEKFNYNVVLSINKANVFDKKKKYKQSIQELSTLINNNIETKWPMNYAIVLGNLAYSKMKNGDLKGVESILIKSLKLSLIYKNESDVINKLINLGEYYLIKKDTAKSRDFLNRALVLGNKIKASNELKLVYGLLSKVEPKRDSYYKDKIIQLTDSLALVQRNNQNKYARIEYETSVVEDANKELSSRNLYLIVGVVVLAGALGIRYVLGQRKELAYRKQLQAAELELFDLMRSSQVELNRAREEEQNRISRELHDNVMNKIYGARLQLGMLNPMTSPEAEEKRSKQIDNLQLIEQDIRSIAHDLYSDVVSHFDFPELLASCVQQATAITEFHLDCDERIDWESISGLVKITIYRIVQEALSNVSKYAEASQCFVTITQLDATSLRLTVTDNGKGFDMNQTTKGIGLKNMSNRARAVKADFTIHSSLEQGTRVECQFVI